MWNLKMFMVLMSALWLVACDDDTKKDNKVSLNAKDGTSTLKARVEMACGEGNGEEAAELGIKANGMITAPSGGKVKLTAMTGKTCAAYLVKWMTSGGTCTAKSQGVDGDGLDLPNVYLSGANAKVNCEVMVGTEKVDISAYTHTSVGIAKATSSAAGKLKFDYDDDEIFDWFLETTDGATLNPASGSVDGEAQEIDVDGIAANHGNVNVWIKHSRGIEKL